MKYVYGIASLVLVVVFGASISVMQGVGCGLAFFATSVLAHELYGLCTGLGASHTPKLMTVLVPMVVGMVIGVAIVKALIILRGIAGAVPDDSLVATWGGVMGALGVGIDYAFQRFCAEE